MLYVFDKNDFLLGQLKSDDLVECVQEEILNGTISINFTTTLESFYKMENVQSVVHKDVNDNSNFYLYKIVRTEPVSGGMAYEGVYTAFDDLKSYGYLREKVQTENAKTTLETVLNGSRWNVGNVPSTSKKFTNFFYSNRLDAISQIIELWDLEVSYRIEIKGSSIYGRYVDFYSKRGTDTGRRFVYGDNALEVVKETSFVDLYTAAIGRGKDVQTDQENPYGNSKKVDFSNISWHIVYKDPVTKPLGQEWLELTDRTRLYGYSDNSPRFKILEFNDIEDPEELLRATYKELEANSRPQVQFKLTSNSDYNLEIGDSVVIVRKDLDIHYSSRVFKVKRDLINGVISELEFGDNIDYSQSKKNRELERNLQAANNKIATLTGNTMKKTEELVEVKFSQVKEVQDEIKENVETIGQDLSSSNEEIKNLQSGNVVLFRSMADNITKVDNFKGDLEVSKTEINTLKDDNIVINKEINEIKTSLGDVGKDGEEVL